MMKGSFSRPGKNSVSVGDIDAIAHAVRTARLGHGLTQAQLAGLSGTGLRFISELERGKPSVAMNKVVAVLAVLGLRLSVAGGET